MTDFVISNILTTTGNPHGKGRRFVIFIYIFGMTQMMWIQLNCYIEETDPNHGYIVGEELLLITQVSPSLLKGSSKNHGFFFIYFKWNILKYIDG